MPALYMSDDFTTAISEYEQDLGIRPGTLCAYDVDVFGVVDLCDGGSLARYDIDPLHLHGAWKEIALVHHRRPPTWDIAVRLFSAGAAGILVPSPRRPAGINLVLWRWNDAPDRNVVALDPLRDLPSDQRSWLG
jgi:RES domain-containing protein